MRIKLVDCDESDMDLWAHNPCATSFFGAVSEWRDKAVRELIGANCKDRNEAAANVRAFDRVLALYSEACEIK